jgi:uncharacterized protein (TIGR02246 family)
MTDAELRARSVLAELEDRLASHDLPTMADYFTDDVVLIGDSEENFDRESTVAYLSVMADMSATVHWEWDRVAVVLDAPGILGFGAAGTMVFHDPEGKPMGDPEPFRVTCLAVEEHGTWRLRHFHGSAPQSGD